MSKEKINSFLKTIEKNRFLVQGTGGNVSWKINNIMWIKASGKSLKNFSREDIFVDVKLKKNGNYEKNDNQKLRPSIETSMHSILPYKYVIHLHSVEHISYSSSNYYSSTNNLFKSCIRVPYTKPGESLANQIKKSIEPRALPKNYICFVLINHGILIGLNDIAEFDNIFNTIKIDLKTNINQQKISKKIISKKYLNCSEKFAYVPKIETKDKSFIKNSVRFCPDNIVFIGHEIPVLTETNNIDFFDNKLVYVQKYGFYFLKKNNSIVNEQIQFYFDVISLVGNICDLNVLNNIEVDEIVNWESEKYRKKLIGEAL